MSKTETDVHHDSTSAVAVGLTILSGLLHVVGYALSKGLVTRHELSPVQVTFLRCVVVLGVGLIATAWPGSSLMRRCLLRPAKAWQRRAAAAALVASNALAVLAYTLPSVTAASALGFTALLLLALLGGLFLHERSRSAAGSGRCPASSACC